MVKDLISKTPISPVNIVEDGVYLNKNIVEIKSQITGSILAYQSVSLFVGQNLGTSQEITDNFDLIWKAYAEHFYDGNILTDSLKTVMEYWHNCNLKNFETFLKEHPMLHTDGLYYGVEEVDRNEMNQQFGSYTIKQVAGLKPTAIQWHSKKDECKEFTVEDFTVLAVAIENYTLPYYSLMQSRKKGIFQCEDKLSVFNIPITYEIITTEE